MSRHILSNRSSADARSSVFVVALGIVRLCTGRKRSDYPSKVRARKGEVKKDPTVGRRTDLPWVGETTYSRFFRRPTVGRFWGCSKPAVYAGWRRAKKFGERKGVGGGALHAGAELLVALTLRLAFDRGTEGVRQAKRAGRHTILIDDVHPIVGCFDVHKALIAQEVVGVHSDT